MKTKLIDERFFVKHHVTEGDVMRVRESVKLPSIVAGHFMKASSTADSEVSNRDSSIKKDAKGRRKK